MISSFTVKKLLPFIAIYILLIAASATIHLALDSAGLKWILKYLGIAGTVSILISFIYSFRKRNIISFGKPKLLLNIHETLAWSGALMILVHSGIQFDAIIPRMALFAMLIVVASGLTGKYLLRDARESIRNKRKELKSKNLSENEIEKELFSLSLVADKMQMWRSVHIPLTVIFAALAILHIIFTLLFWQW